MEQPKRLILPDILKGLAVVFMIQIHITELFIDNTGRESALGSVSLFLGGPFAAVVFMMVMGYFVAHNTSSLQKNLVRGIKIFVLGFLLNIGLNFHLLLKIKFANWPYNPLEYIVGVDILYLAGLSIIILSLLKLLKKWHVWIALILLIVVATTTGFMNEVLMDNELKYIAAFFAGEYSWSYFPLFPWLIYPLAGFVFHGFESEIKLFVTQNKIAAGILLSAIAFMVLLFYKQGFQITINLPLYYHHTFWYILWALGVAILWISLIYFTAIRFSNTWLSIFLGKIGKNVTLIYVIQWLIIGNISTAIYQTQRMDSFLFWFGGIFIVSFILTFLLAKIKVKIL